MPFDGKGHKGDFSGKKMTLIGKGKHKKGYTCEVTDCYIILSLGDVFIYLYREKTHKSIWNDKLRLQC